MEAVGLIDRFQPQTSLFTSFLANLRILPSSPSQELTKVMTTNMEIQCTTRKANKGFRTICILERLSPLLALVVE
eukprot:scaffold22564_cov118-Cylindrotheca_fusiformis.AAC.3